MESLPRFALHLSFTAREIVKDVIFVFTQTLYDRAQVAIIRMVEKPISLGLLISQIGCFRWTVLGLR
jgi:hypothetical protein